MVAGSWEVHVCRSGPALRISTDIWGLRNGDVDAEPAAPEGFQVTQLPNSNKDESQPPSRSTHAHTHACTRARTHTMELV